MIMNAFAEKFQYYLNEKGMKVGDVRRFSGMNLTTLYKLLDGTREPTKLDAVEKIADSLCLNREEREDLIESFYLTRLGPLGYYGRKEVRDFYHNLNFEANEEPQPFLPFKEISLNPGENMVLKGKQNVDVALEYFVARAAEENPESTIRISEFLENTLMLSIIANVSSLYPEVRFVHTLRLDEMNADNVEQEGMFYNVHILGKVLSFASRHENYKVFYRYTNAESEKTQLSALSCLVLAGDYVIQYSPNHRYCIVERSRSVSELFDKIAKEETGSVTQLIYRFEERDQNGAGDAYRLFHDPVIGASGYLYYSGFLSHAFYENSGTREIRDFIFDLTQKVSAIVLPQYFIDDFAADEAYGSKEERAEKLNELLEVARVRKIGIVEGEKARFPEHFFSTITLSTLYIGLPDRNGGIVMLALSEPTIVHAFYDFIDSLYKQESRSAKEAAGYLEEKIKELKDG